MNKKEKIQLKNAYRALNKIFKIIKQLDDNSEITENFNLENYFFTIEKYKPTLVKYLYIIEAELDDILKIYPKKVEKLKIFTENLM